MKKTVNSRCPLANECGRPRCEFVDHELDCVYYSTNGVEGNTIADQEEIRNVREMAAMEEMFLEYEDDSITREGWKMTEIEYIPVACLRPHPDNPRKDLGDVSELAESIRKQGIMQNLTVIPCEDEPGAYTVIIGHRRLAAAKAAGLTEVPCIVTGMTQKEQLATMLLENMQRSDLSPYEEANGFQMMLDLGETVETIAKESGFSQTTVRRRVKMMELDQDILKQVSSERQLSLSDFDKLAKIDDLTKRNEVLKTIGTENFNQEFTQKYRHQEIAKGIKALKGETKRLKAKKMERGDTWNGNYERVKSYKLSEWDRKTPLEPGGKGKKLFYYIEEYSGEVSFYIEKERKRAAPVRKSPEELEKEHQIEKAWARADELREVTRSLRLNFVKGLTVNSHNREAMLNGAVKACLIHVAAYTSTSNKLLFESLGLEPTNYYSDALQKCSIGLHNDFAKQAPMVIYSAFGDSNYSCDYIEGFKKEWPKKKACPVLDALYDWLVSVGYVMSDDEKGLAHGSHEIFHRGDSEAKDDE